MSVEELESAVSRLSAEEFARFSACYRHESVALNSFVAETIIGLPSGDRRGLLQYEEDFQAFSMELLSPLRTFVEKLVAIPALWRRE